MRVCSRILLILALTLIFVSHSSGQETLWKELNVELADLYRQGKYQEAVEVAERAAQVAEKTFEPDHVRVAISLNNLATLYRLQGRYGEAESLYKRSLNIKEQALG
jgi:tetratricopeptide (TPR) repeat protein